MTLANFVMPFTPERRQRVLKYWERRLAIATPGSEDIIIMTMNEDEKGETRLSGYVILHMPDTESGPHRGNVQKLFVSPDFRRQGIAIKGVLTDNGTGYRSHRFRQACSATGLRHLRTKPRCPQTNGKAERFIPTLLREWAYAYRYPSSDVRAAELHPWMQHYNFSRPHSAVICGQGRSRRCGEAATLPRGS